MSAELHTFALIAVISTAFGYIAGNTRQLNGWKVGILGLVVWLFAESFDYGRSGYLIMVAAFLIGFLLPHAHLLEGFGRAVSNAVNAVRYRSFYADLKRKEEELESMRRQYESADAEHRQKQAEAQWRRRRKASANGGAKRDNGEKGGAEQGQNSRKRQSGSGSSNNNYKRAENDRAHSSSGAGGHKSSDRTSSRTTPPPLNALRHKYLEELGLVAGQDYSKAELKTAFRRCANKYHPDKHEGKTGPFIAQMEKKFMAVKHAHEWLEKNVDN